MRLTADDWGRIAGNKLDARWAMLTRRLAVSGDLRLALRLPKVLGLSVNP
jgi:putative sterol carrier protein